MPRRDDDAPLDQVAPTHGHIPTDDAEHELRRLYPHPRGVVRLGMIAGTDGAAVAHDGSSRGLGGVADLRVLRALRAQADAVLVGGRTARVERYGPIRLPTAMAGERVAVGLAAAPALVIATFTGDLPDGLGPGDALLLTTRHSPAYAALADAWGPSIVPAGEHVLDLAAGVEELRDRGLGKILCEGGPTVAAALLDAGLVDDYCLTVSPVAGSPGGGTVPDVPASMRLAHRLASGEYTMERWVR